MAKLTQAELVAFHNKFVWGKVAPDGVVTSLKLYSETLPPFYVCDDCGGGACESLLAALKKAVTK